MSNDQVKLGIDSTDSKSLNGVGTFEVDKLNRAAASIRVLGYSWILI